MSLEDFTDENGLLNNDFVKAVDTRTVVILNRDSTKNGSPLTETFNLNFKTITQAILKINLHADKGRILEFIPNEFKLNTITVNGKLFHPSDARNSINIIEKSNDSRLNHILKPGGENTISVDFSAPIGAGLTSPNAEISAFLTIIGEESNFPALPNSTQLLKDFGSKITDIRNFSIPILILIAIIGISLTFIITRVKPVG